MSEDHMVSRELSQASSVKVLTELLARLEAADGPDRALDFLALHSLVHLFPRDTPHFPEWGACPPFTASLDAALALAERSRLSAKAVLLMAVVDLDVYELSVWLGRLPLAVCRAIIRALIAANADTSEPS